MHVVHVDLGILLECFCVAIRFSKSYVFSGGANTWTWDELASQMVEPPYRPHLVSACNHLYYFVLCAMYFSCSVLFIIN